jgi:hypothetical protein
MENEAKTEQKHMPERKFKAGAITATVWANDRIGKSGETINMSTVALERTYKDREGQWKRTGSMTLNDLPKAALVLSKAYEYLTLKEFNAA